MVFQTNQKTHDCISGGDDTVALELPVGHSHHCHKLHERGKLVCQRHLRHRLQMHHLQHRLQMHVEDILSMNTSPDFLAHQIYVARPKDCHHDSDTA